MDVSNVSRHQRLKHVRHVLGVFGVLMVFVHRNVMELNADIVPDHALIVQMSN